MKNKKIKNYLIIVGNESRVDNIKYKISELMSCNMSVKSRWYGHGIKIHQILIDANSKLTSYITKTQLSDLCENKLVAMRYISMTDDEVLENVLFNVFGDEINMSESINTINVEQIADSLYNLCIAEDVIWN